MANRWGKGPAWMLTLTDSTLWSSFVEHENNYDPTTKEVSNRVNEEGIDIIMDYTRLNTLFKIIGVIVFILRFVYVPTLWNSKITEKIRLACNKWITTCRGTMDNELSAGQYSTEIGKLEVTDQQKIVSPVYLRLFLDITGTIRCGWGILNAS